MNTLKVLFDGAQTGTYNMDRDAELLESHKPGDDPILRLYRWEPAAVTIGYNQKFEDFDEDRISAAGYDLVRRPTGGRAILHADELTYAVIGTSPGPLFGDSLNTSYTKINEALLAFLQALNIQADISDGESRDDARALVCFKSAGRHEITVAGRKLIGSAQRRRDGVFLQHGSILAGPRHLDLPTFLRPGTRGADMPKEVLAMATTDLGQVLGETQTPERLDGLMPTLAEAFQTILGLKVSSK